MRNEVRVRAGQCKYVVPRVHGTDHGRWGFGDRCAAIAGNASGRAARQHAAAIANVRIASLEVDNDC